MARPTDLVQGTLDLLILKILSLEPAHGWAIAKRIQQVSRDVLQVQQGSLYPALHRLETRGGSPAPWGGAATGRPPPARAGARELGAPLRGDQLGRAPRLKPPKGARHALALQAPVASAFAV